MRPIITSLTVGFAIVITGCATPQRMKPGASAEELFVAACQPGKAISDAKGHLWVKANSKEVSGQFPADVVATSPDQLKLEITNPLGGTEALVVVSGNHYEIKGGRGQKQKREEGFGSWGGIPLKWATQLFLGKIPCPDPSRKWQMATNATGELVVETGGPEAIEPERFTYKFIDFHGKPWPDHLVWQKLGSSGVSVEFIFEDPESDTLSPKRWEAKSKKGSVKVRWRSREVKSSLVTGFVGRVPASDS